MACAQGMDLFSQAPIQNLIERTEEVVCRPLTKVFGDGPIEILVEAEAIKFIDLRRTKMFVVVRITQEDGSLIGPEDNVGFTNLPFHTMWKQVELATNNVVVTSCSPTYHLRAYLTTLLSYGADAKSTQLGRELWQEDTPGKFDDISGGNLGLEYRKSFSKNSQYVELSGYLHLDFMQQEHYLVNGTSVMLRFLRNPNCVSLMAPKNSNYKIEIVDCELSMKRHIAYPGVQKEVEQKLRSSPAQYEVNRMLFKQIAVPANQLSFHCDNLFLGQQPHRAVVVMIDQDAYNGAYDKNPFYFKHNNLTDLHFNLEGQMFPQVPFKPNFAEKKYLRCYESMFEALGKSGLDEGNNIKRPWYDKGYTIFACDFTPDSSDGCTRNPFKVGKTSLSATFAEKLPNDIYVFVMAEYNNKIEVNANRHVIMDYTL